MTMKSSMLLSHHLEQPGYSLFQHMEIPTSRLEDLSIDNGLSVCYTTIVMTHVDSLAVWRAVGSRCSACNPIPILLTCGWSFCDEEFVLPHDNTYNKLHSSAIEKEINQLQTANHNTSATHNSTHMFTSCLLLLCFHWKGRHCCCKPVWKTKCTPFIALIFALKMSLFLFLVIDECCGVGVGDVCRW